MIGILEICFILREVGADELGSCCVDCTAEGFDLSGLKTALVLGDSEELRNMLTLMIESSSAYTAGC